jgi:hypothetical protein
MEVFSLKIIGERQSCLIQLLFADESCTADAWFLPRKTASGFLRNFDAD